MALAWSVSSPLSASVLSCFTLSAPPPTQRWAWLGPALPVLLSACAQLCLPSCSCHPCGDENPAKGNQPVWWGLKFTASRALVYNVFVLESIIGWHKWWWWGSHVMIGAWSNNEQIYSQPISTSLQRHLWTRPCTISGHQSPPWAELGRDRWLLQRRAHLSPQPWENYKKLRMQLRNGYGSVLLQTNDHYCVSISLTLSSIPIKMKMVFARRQQNNWQMLRIKNILHLRYHFTI